MRTLTVCQLCWMPHFPTLSLSISPLSAMKRFSPDTVYCPLTSTGKAWHLRPAPGRRVSPRAASPQVWRHTTSLALSSTTAQLVRSTYMAAFFSPWLTRGVGSSISSSLATWRRFCFAVVVCSNYYEHGCLLGTFVLVAFRPKFRGVNTHHTGRT